MSIASVILLWEEGGRLSTRLTTNASRKVVEARLRACGLHESVAEMQAFFGDRAEGGNGYVILWTSNTEPDWLRNGLSGF